jgi:hypothetical protein
VTDTIVSKSIAQTPIGDLKPYDKNPRTHSAEQITQIAASITEFGFTNPILVADEEVVAGHGRLEAAKLLGLDQVPVIDVSHLSMVQRRAYVIADNQLALNAEWDTSLLNLEMGELNSGGFDLSLLGFDDEEFVQLSNSPEDELAIPSNIVFGGNRFLIQIEFEEEASMQTVWTELNDRGFKLKILE